MCRGGRCCASLVADTTAGCRAAFEAWNQATGGRVARAEHAVVSAAACAAATPQPPAGGSEPQPHATIVVVGALSTNCVVIQSDVEAIIIDPGGDPTEILTTLRPGVKTSWILHTHGHLDHFCSTPQVARHTACTNIALHADDAMWWSSWEVQNSYMHLDMKEEVPEPTVWLTEDTKLPFGGRIIHTPGHTAGSVCIWFPDLSILCTGDTLFAGSVGRTDLPGGDLPTLRDSILSRILPLATSADGGDFAIIPGHGVATTLKQELSTNPFIISWRRRSLL